MRPLHLAGLLLIVLQAALLGAGSGDFAVPVMVVFVALLAAFGVRAPIGRWLLSAVLALTAGGLALMDRSQPGPFDGALAIFSTSLTRPVGEFFLIWQSLELLRRRPTGEMLPAYFPCLSIATFVCAFDQSRAEIGQEFYLLIAFVMLAVVIVFFQQTGGSQASRIMTTGPRRGKIAATLIVISTLTAWCASSAWLVATRMVRINIPIWAAETAGFAQGSPLYVRSGGLNSISQEKRTSPMSVALRIYSNRQPGYLRGRVFDTYQGGRWYIASLSRRGERDRYRGMRQIGPLREPAEGVENDEGGHSTFRVGDAQQRPTLKMEIWNDPQRGEMFFTALGAQYMRGFGKRLLIDEHRVVHAGFLTTEPYQVYGQRPPLPNALTPARRQRLLAPLAGIDPAIADLAKQVGRGKTSTVDKIAAVESFFQTEFEYRDSPREFPKNVDPLSRFLVDRLDAHCEFFASGAVALLRMQGVPTRYVTGYVATELEDEYGDFWIARNRNAHAWAEAYDDAKGVWVVVEATPGMEAIHDETIENEIDAGDEAENNDLMAARQSWAVFWRVLWRRLRFPAAIVGIIGGVFYLGFRNGLFDKPPPAAAESPELAQQRRRLRKLEARLRRRKLARRSDETLHQYAARIQAAAGDDEWIRRSAAWLRQFAQLRYGGEGELAKAGEPASLNVDAAVQEKSAS